MSTRRQRLPTQPLGLALAALVLAGTAGLTYHSLTELSRRADRQQQLQQDLRALDDFLLTLTQAETSHRAYILTGAAWHRDSYEATRTQVADRLNRIEHLLQAPQQGEPLPQNQQRLERLQQLTQQRLDSLDAARAAYEQDATNRETQIAFTNQGTILQDQIRVLLAQLEGEMGQTLDTRSQPLRRAAQQTLLLALGGFSASLLLFLSARSRLAHQTEQRQAAQAAAQSSQAALQISEERFQAIFDQAAVGLVQMNRQGQLLRVNSWFRQMLGYETGALIQHSLHELIHPEDREASLGGLQQLLTGQRQQLALEQRYRHQHGSYLWVNVSLALVRDPQGEPDYFIAAVADISDRKLAQRDRQAAESALRQSEARYSSLTNDVLDKSAVGIFILDADFRVVWVNQVMTEFLGMAREALIGRDNRQLIRDRLCQIVDQPEAFANTVLATYDNNTYIEQFECHVLPASHRQERWLEHLSQPIHLGLYAGGRIEHYTDITTRKRAESALWESEQRLRQFIKHIPTAVAILDRELRYLNVSQRWLSDYGLGTVAVIGHSHYELFPEIPERWREIHQRCLQGEVLRSDDDCFERINGKLEWLHWEVRPWMTRQGTVGGLMIFSEVITQRKEAELALLQSETRHRAAIAAIPDLLLRIDCDGYYHDYIAAKNQRELLSSDRIGRHLSEVLPPPLVEPQLYYIQQALTTGQLQSFEQSFEVDGQLYHEEVRLAVSGDREVLAIVRDITERKQAEAALQAAKRELEQRVAERTAALSMANERLHQELWERQQVTASLQEAERRWRSLLENVRLAVIGLDPQGRVEYANPFLLELTGYQEREVLGRDWLRDFIPATQRAEVQQVFQTLIKQAQSQSYYCNTILTKAGEERWIAWNNTLLRSADAQPLGTLSIGSDITESQAIERMKDEFISVVSHELRTPLTSIHGALNLLANGLVDLNSPRGDRIIKIAAESAERLTRLVNDILELERLESGKIYLAKRWVNGADLVAQAAEQMQVVANRARISLNIMPTDVEFYADPDRILQVLTNLLSNAIKFSPPGTTVGLSVERGELFAGFDTQTQPRVQQFAMFAVEDRGRGIPPEKLETIFERFHQVDASDSRNKGGTGLGLAICRSIIEQHQGRIWVESQLQVGSIFSFTIPLCTEADEEVADTAVEQELDDRPTLPAPGHYDQPEIA